MISGVIVGELNTTSVISNSKYSISEGQSFASYADAVVAVKVAAAITAAVMMFFISYPLVCYRLKMTRAIHRITCPAKMPAIPEKSAAKMSTRIISIALSFDLFRRRRLD
jgi:hypothetical protein